MPVSLAQYINKVRATTSFPPPPPMIFAFCLHPQVLQKILYFCSVAKAIFFPIRSIFDYKFRTQKRILDTQADRFRLLQKNSLTSWHCPDHQSI